MFEVDDISRTITTARLLLRPPRMEDAQNIFQGFSSDPEVTRYLAWPRHRSLTDTLEFIQYSIGEWKAWPAGPYLIEDRDKGELLGSTGIAYETDYRASTGFVLARDAWGEGYASEVLAAMVSQARRLGLQRLYALCHTDHRNSSRVLEKNGFLFEGILHRYLLFPNLEETLPADVDCYALILDPDNS